MKNSRTLRTLARTLLGAALTSASAFAITPEDLAALRRKAETGDGIAQHNLGLVYANPQEMMTDLIESYAWLNLAADNGATGRSLLIVTRQMTPAQISEGKRRFEEIRDAIAANKKNPSPGPVTEPPAPEPSPIRAVQSDESPVSASPISSAAETEHQAELTKISAELAAAWKETEELKVALARAEETAKDASSELQKERDQLAASLENSMHEIATMKAAAANFEGERNGLLQKIAEAQRASDGEMRLKLVAAETELAAAKTAAAREIETIKASLAALGEREQKLTAENQRLNALVISAGQTADEATAAAEKSLGGVRAELAQAKTRIQNLESAQAALENDRKDLTAKLTAAVAGAVSPAELARTAAEAADLKSRLSASQQALASANADVASLRQELQSAKTGVVPVAQLRELQTKLDEATRVADEQKRANEELKQAHEALIAEKTGLAAELVAAAAAATEEVATLKAGAANFEGERNGLVEKIKETEGALAAATDEAETLKQRLAAMEKETVPLERQRELEARLASTEEAALAARGAVADLEKKLAGAEAQRDELAQKLENATETAMSELAALRAGAANFEGERNGLLEKIGGAEEALARAVAETAAVKAQLAATEGNAADAGRLAGELARATAERDELKAAAAASETALAETARARDEEKNARAELEKTLAALQAEREELAAASSASEGETAQLKAASANFEGERNGLLEKIAEQQETVARATNEIAGLKTQLAAATAGSVSADQLQTLQAQADAAAREQVALKEANAALETERARLAGELAAAQVAASDASAATADVETLEARAKAGEEAAATAQAERDAMAQRVTALEQQVSEASAASAGGEDPAALRKELDDVSAKLAATLRSFQIKDEEVDRLQKSLVSTDEERAALAERIAAAEKQAADARAASAEGLQAAAELARIHEQLRHAQNQIGQLAAENSQLKNRVTPASSALVLSPPRRPADTASPTTPQVRAPQVAEPRIHTVVEGETLTRIARRYYGRSERWADIYDANRASLPNPAALKIGMKLRIP